MPSPLLSAVTAYIDAQGGGEGLFPTCMEGVNIISSFQEQMPMRRVYRPSLCVVLQGAKQILFGEDVLDYGEMECLVVSVELPASGRIVKASPNEPFIGLTIDLDVAMMRDVLEQLETPRRATSTDGPCVFVGQVDEPLADCVARLVRMADTPKAVPILYPSVMREICYWLLSGPHGGELYHLALPDSHVTRVVKAIYFLRDSFAKTLRVEQMAEVARMSPSSFHQHFKALTSMSPLQFQKELRLLEARRLMVADAASVAEAAYRVGYESASQFSREYSRMFGVAPKRDAINQKRLYATYGSREVRTA
ncbi:AraC family transcriptional regulator [Ancylobacter oerskovii]|uniref:AraC family transcriptional regulator N-terminal domain-containing protein n=1 Tax=Ancylobacter oerskovii TaxID=459519 RepID=A0ABW4Z579_9HYPH|nr:AraC family transcriptional regulator [Ancylobacter oerskovii]MBS7542514.1 AraC family transcriptional regulator [Ancylobacter oerskovii]